MDIFKRKDKRTLIDKEMDSVLEAMKDVPVTDEHYKEYLSALDRLASTKEKVEPQKAQRKKIDPNTMLVVSANMLGMVAIMTYEKWSVISTKAFGWLLKPKF